VEWSGGERSGVEWSGVEWSGVEWSGVRRSAWALILVTWVDGFERLGWIAGIPRWVRGAAAL
jgi:hypothetical protein